MAAQALPLSTMAALPQDWGSLPELRYAHAPDLAPAINDYVRDEVAAGRCAVPKGSRTLQVDLAVLVNGGGPIRRIVPRAIHCPTVEQYASGLVSSLARDNLDSGSADGWYRTRLDFTWTE